MEYENVSFDAWAKSGDKMDDTTLKAFLIESNGIEGITKMMGQEMAAARHFLKLDEITIEDLKTFVRWAEPGAQLRDEGGLDVRVGPHIPPPGGSEIRRDLQNILRWMTRPGSLTEPDFPPFRTHQLYEQLHPFTDCNGRSGRMLWLWQMEKFHGGAPLGFLHTFYYQSLQHKRG